MTEPKKSGHNEESLEDVLKRFNEIKNNWPYDTSVAMTDEQL